MKERLPLIVVLVASLLLSIGFAVRLPLDHNPDESSHRDYIRLMVEQKGLVMFVPPPGRAPLPEALLKRMQVREAMTELPEGSPSRDETHQPPLYYVLGALLFALTHGNLLALRLLAVPFQLATVWVAWRAGRDLFPKRPELAVGIAAMVAFLPIQAQLAGAVSNDAPTHLLCALIVWRCLRLVAPHIPPPRLALAAWEGARIGLLFGIGLLTKLTVLQLYPVLLLAGVLGMVARRFSSRDLLLLFGLAFGLGIWIASPWFVRNQLLYGDPLAQTIYRATGPNFTPDAISAMVGWSSTDYARNVALRSFVSFWYFLDPNLPLNPLARFIGPAGLLLLVLVLAIVPLLALYKKPLANEEKPIVALAALIPLCLLPFFVKFVYEVFQAQGRYFLPALLGVAVTCVAGCAQLGGTKQRALAALIPGGLLLLITLFQLANGGYVALR